MTPHIHKISNSKSDPVCGKKSYKMCTRKMDVNVNWKKELKIK